MATIAYRILKFESMIKTPVFPNYVFFAVVTFSKINSFACITAFITFDIQKDFRQDNLPFDCLQFYKHNCLNIVTSNTCFRIQIKN